MALFQLGVVTSLRFTRSLGDRRTEDTETVLIRFGGREFVWHDPGDENDPTVVAVYEDSPTDRAEVAHSAERLLSALAYAEDVSIASYYQGTSLGGNDPWHAPAVHPPRSEHFKLMATPPDEVVVADEPLLWKALALNREGLTARSPFYRFLSFWNAMEVALPDRTELDRFLDARGPHIWPQKRSDAPLPAQPLSEHLRESSRNAVAHAIRDRPDRVAVDADDPHDRARLLGDASVLRVLVCDAIARRWPAGVNLVWDP